MHTAVSEQPDGATAATNKIRVRSLVSYLAPFLHYDYLQWNVHIKASWDDSSLRVVNTARLEHKWASHFCSFCFDFQT